MDVRKCMTTRPVTASANSPLADALELMAQHGLRHIPVIETGRRFVGVIHECDVRTALKAEVGDAPQRDVLNVTRLGTPTLHGGEEVQEVWNLLSRSPWLDPLPVLRNGKLVGTVSHHDLLRALAGLPPKAPAKVTQEKHAGCGGANRLSAMVLRNAVSSAGGRTTDTNNDGPRPPYQPRAAG